MNRFICHTSNRMEVLAGKLAGIMKNHPAPPFAEEIVIVQSRGIANYITNELSKRNGIAAHIRFPFPNRFISDVFENMLSPKPDSRLFEAGLLKWRIMKTLQVLANDRRFAPVGQYLSKDVKGLKLHQLSEKTADLFDMYQIFRPDFIGKWDTGLQNDWQSLLWAELAMGHEKEHISAVRNRFFLDTDKLAAKGESFSGRGGVIPSRFYIFGISTLPLFHMEIFERLSFFSEIHLFFLNPCREYWADIMSDRESDRLMGRLRLTGNDNGFLHAEAGNPLLSSLGRTGRDFHGLLVDMIAFHEEDFRKPEGDALLDKIQADILDLKDGRALLKNKGDSAIIPPDRIIRPGDGSIDIHICHGPLRETEVLYDQMLSWMDADPTLSPWDIIVMTPDIEIYAPYIRAVFEKPLAGGRKIPFGISDKSQGKEGGITGSFLEILTLPGTRFTAGNILSILENQVILDAFGLESGGMGDAVETIRQWIGDTRIRWSWDEKEKEGLELPSSPENTWKSGLNRLLLGYAMLADDALDLYGGLAPHAPVEGDNAQLLGRFTRFMETLNETVRELKKPKALGEWSAYLSGVLETFFPAVNEETDEQAFIRGALADLGRVPETTGFDMAVGHDIILSHITASMKERDTAGPFLNAGVTFCAMLPMRSIPARIICLMGMGFDAIPRRDNRPEFDLAAKEPRRGDRSRRNDDRYLFLESLISAREKFYISYVGFSPDDNGVMPPSVLVSELIDYIDAAFVPKGAIGGAAALSVKDIITTSHRLQGFHPAYFSEKHDGKRFSYARDKFNVSKKIAMPPENPPPFFAGPLPETESNASNAPVCVSMTDLNGFFGNPCRFILTRRLGVSYADREDIIPDEENFTFDTLEKYQFHNMLFPLMEKGLDPVSTGRVTQGIRSLGILPHGSVGDVYLKTAVDDIRDIRKELADYFEAPKLAPLDIDLEIRSENRVFRLTGRLLNIHGPQQFLFRFATIKPKDRLRAWIHHLALGMTRQAGYPGVTVLAGSDQKAVFKAVDNPEPVLAALLGYYAMGLTYPLCFFPYASYAYASAVKKSGKDPDKALDAARNSFFTAYEGRGEYNDPYIFRCFENFGLGGSSPEWAGMNACFVKTAEDVLFPLLDHQAEEGI